MEGRSLEEERGRSCVVVGIRGLLEVSTGGARRSREARGRDPRHPKKRRKNPPGGGDRDEKGKCGIRS